MQVERGGILLDLPESLRVQRATRGRAARAPATDAVVAALSERFDTVDTVPLEPTVAPTPLSGRRRGAGVPGRRHIDIAVDVGAGESAVVLVEQDGIYSWAFGTTPAPSVRRRADAGTVRFRIEVNASTPTRRSSRSGLLSHVLLRPMKVVVFKFVARASAKLLVRQLERKLRRGWVAMVGDDPSRWEAPTGRIALGSGTPKLLVFVHGTFSSTRGGFGSLAATPHGRALLDDLAKDYDATLGFDHPTLSDDPLENARALASLLTKLRPKGSIDVDIVTHSRGALVARSLVEQVLDDESRVRVRRVVMLAGPNNGTPLAEPERWKHFVDVATNLGGATARAISLAAPPTAVAMTVLHGVLDAVSTFVKAFASAAFDDETVPGLAAMRPRGAFVSELNKAQRQQLGAGPVDLFAITSDFDITNAHVDSGIGERLKVALRDTVTDGFIGAPNDLVVDVASMDAVGLAASGYIRDEFAFGVNPRVHHSNYFLQPEVVRALRRWLAVGRADATRGGGGGPPSSGDLAAVVNTNLLEVRSTTSVRDALAEVSIREPDFVVVRRAAPEQGGPYFYGLTRPEFEHDVARRARGKLGLSLDELGEFHESNSSATGGPTEVVRLGHGVDRRDRVVVRSADRTIGVVPVVADLTVGRPSPPDQTDWDRPVSAPKLQAREPRVRASKKRSAATPVHPRHRGGGRRGAARGTASMGSPARAAAPPRAQTRSRRTSVDQHFRAEMADEVKVGSTVTVAVDVSTDALQAQGRGAATGRAKVDPNQVMTVTLIPRQGFRTVGTARHTLEPVTAGTRRLEFKARAVHASPGELWVVVQQQADTLLTLSLRPTITTGKPTSRRRAVADAPVAMLKKPRARTQLNIQETFTGDGVVYNFDFRSQVLDVCEFAQSPVIRGDRECYVAKLYREIEERWVQSANDVEAFTQELRAFGRQLFKELVPPVIQNLLWEHREQIDSIEVVSTEPFIPWELVHVVAPGRASLAQAPEVFLGSLGMVRWLHGAGFAPTELRIRKGHVVCVVPEYPPDTDWELTETHREYEFLRRARGAKRADVDTNGFRDLVSRPDQFDLLHYAGHGLAEPDDVMNARIVLGVALDDDGNWREEKITSTTVEGFACLRRDDGPRPVVVLNACQVGRAGYQLTGIGGFAQAFLRGGAGAFVSSMWSVGDQPAREFTETMYRRLFAGDRLCDAVGAGRTAARDAGDATWLAYVVYGDAYATVTPKPTKRRKL